MLQDDLTCFYYPLPLCLRFVSLQQFPPTLDFIRLASAYRGGIAALAAFVALSAEGGRTALTAVCTTENACTVDRRKLGCTDARSAERQRIIEAEANRLAPTMAASEAMPPRRDFHSPGAVPLRAASLQCNFLWVGLREGYLFFKKRYPSLVRAAPSALPSPTWCGADIIPIIKSGRYPARVRLRP